MGGFKLPDGRTLNFLYNGIALLKLREGDAVKRVVIDNTALFNAASALAEGGELWNRYMGFEPSQIPSSEDFAELNKAQRLKLRIAVLKAIVNGAGKSEQKEDEYEDVVLAELNAREEKNESETTEEILSVGAIAGLTPRESFLVPVGMLNKLAENAAKRGGAFPWLMA